MPTQHTTQARTQQRQAFIETFQRELVEYNYLLNHKDRSLDFPEALEKRYQQALEALFFRTNSGLIKAGLPIYISFLLIDYLFYPELFVLLGVFRMISVSYIAFLIYRIVKKQSSSFMHTTTFGLCLCTLQIFCSSQLFEQPMDIIYSAGMLPVYVYAITLLRFSFKHTLIYCVVFTLVSLLAAGISYANYEALPQNMEVYYVVAVPALAVFVVMFACMGVYLSRSIDKLTRENWLREQISLLDKKHMGHLTDELKHLSETDSLTGLYNRRFLDKHIVSEWNKSTHAKQPISLMMIDIDWFKPYNDYYGHQKGDQTLQEIARTLALTLQVPDCTIARYGGEEFFILLPNTGQAEAETLAQSLQQALGELHIPHHKSQFARCTISMGIHTVSAESLIITNVGDMFSQIEAAMKLADDALYTAKAQGRNQYVIA